jgi:hypothetical protein
MFNAAGTNAFAEKAGQKATEVFLKIVINGKNGIG